MMKNFYTICAMGCISALSGCATLNGLTAGTSAGQLPITQSTETTNAIPTSFVAQNGMQYNISELTTDNLPRVSHVANSRPLSLPKSRTSVGDYRITAGDVIGIVLPSYPEITPLTPSNGNNMYGNGYLVDQTGYLQFPMIGRVKATGLTATQLSQALASRLSRYLKQPDPQVRVLSYRGNKFFIDGQVKTPGEFSIADQPVSIYSAIGMAGGATTTADTENITLNRGGRTYHFGLKSMSRLGYSPNNMMIQDGDAIHINNMDQNKVIVVGEFTKPSPVQIPEDGISLAGVIGEVSGLDKAGANARMVYVLRENPAQYSASIYHVNLTNLTNMSLANRFEMQAGDVVYVDPTGLARWNRVISLLLPATSLSSLVSQF
ncbi:MULTISPECIES: polysaccharide biosynthesis/export family protein [unclassified Moraxella]|uniref:polysaccharide biosynthesis/export family protein n=1 Tax=unclassified Moraxella TaxID=2685852 RepID=UPI003AF776E3